MTGPRTGAAGLWDRLVGPGATPAEDWLTACWALACAAAAAGYALVAHLGWSPAQLAVAALVAADVGGGVSANASNSAKGWFHRPGQGARQHLLFVFAHVHPFVLALAFPPFGWGAAAALYSYLLAASLAIVLVPLYLKRPVAFVTYCGALLVGLYAIGAPAGLEWFAPFFFLKLLVAHLLPEEAYRPAKGEA
jgi:hypothetical protein